MNLEKFNNLGKQQAREELIKCCTSLSWVEAVEKRRPFSNLRELKDFAQEVWFSLSKTDWLEAFEGHPMIGDVESLKAKFSNTKKMASSEQGLVVEADEEVIKELSTLNKEYFEKYGFIFIVFATGKSAVEMLNILKSRIVNSKEDEIKNASIEQNKITILRLEKVLCTQ